MNDKKIIDTLKSLAIDMINNAQSGHPGIALGAAPIIYTLYAYHLRFNPQNAKWLNRDRFVLSAGHASALLYANLFLVGYDLEIADLKNFRTIESRTPGHPEYKKTPGIETTTGPLGQGLATAVGIALSERIYRHKCNEINKKNDLINYYTYVLCSDGDLMEGISYEAASFAGVNNLGKLIVLYDSNNITLDGSTSNTFTEDVLKRFEAMNWHTENIKNSLDIMELNKAINKAKAITTKPSIIKINTIIGKGSIYENTNKIHGGVLDAKDLEQLKNKLGIRTLPFYVSKETTICYRKQIEKRNLKEYKKWQELYNICKNEAEYKPLFDILEKNNLDMEFDSDKIELDGQFKESLRSINNKILNIIASHSSYFYGGSADLATSCATKLNNSNKNINFGVREHAMGAILNGLALSNLRVFGSTFLAFSDYLKPAIRLTAMMDLAVTYIFTHDSINIGQDGPTHQPIEQLSALRSIPNLTVYRPADITEIIGSWENILQRKKPAALIISRKKLPRLNSASSKLVKKGAYVVRKEQKKLDGIIIATGSEVHSAIHIAEKLFCENIDIRVVSMVSQELFDQMETSYQNMILPIGSKIITLEASDPTSWYKYTYRQENVLALNDFGSSGNSQEVLDKYNFSEEKLYELIKKKLS